MIKVVIKSWSHYFKYKTYRTCSLCLGYCFKFNPDGAFISHTAGNSGGISLILNALTDEYYIGPSSYSEGFSVSMQLVAIF